MNKLNRELRRLYAAQAPDAAAQGWDDTHLIDSGAPSQVRALVLELARPADWAALQRVWQGVQADLELPAPAIAVNGKDGYQLWFSVATPVTTIEANVWLDALRLRYLGDIKPQRLTLLPMPEPGGSTGFRHAPTLPALQPDGTLWSAFVAPDLAPIFADEPWLDTPPNLEGQAKLLLPLKSMSRAQFDSALQQLQLVAVPVPATLRTSSAPTPAHADRDTLAAPASLTSSSPTGQWNDPERFLLDVMNNPNVPLALRIDAAKALLPHGGSGSQRG